MIFTQDDKARIVQCVKAIEARSATELVVAVVGRSGEYGFARASVTAVLMLALSMLWFAGDLFSWALESWVPESWALVCLMALQVATFLFGWLLSGWSPLLRLLVSKEVLQEAAEGRALQLFAARGVHHTADRSGLLVMFSQAEHQVVILGDAGIDARMGADGWQKQVDVLVQGLRKGNAMEALDEVLEDLGAQLAEAFPRRPDDVNELGDEVVELAR